jgi:hypothetical protein
MHMLGWGMHFIYCTTGELWKKRARMLVRAVNAGSDRSGTTRKLSVQSPHFRASSFASIYWYMYTYCGVSESVHAYLPSAKTLAPIQALRYTPNQHFCFLTFSQNESNF